MTPDLSLWIRDELETITTLFPDLSSQQKEQLAQLHPLYKEWNEKINVISRKDIDHVYKHHVLHSLSIAHFLPFPSGSVVVDVGTGGGFPAIPLAILFPDVEFHLVDSVGKKLTVARGVAEAIGLQNVSLYHTRCESLHLRCHYVVSRAAMAFPQLLSASRHLVALRPISTDMPNGLICLKGGNLVDELADYEKRLKQFDIEPWLQDEYFSTKKVIYLPL